MVAGKTIDEAEQTDVKALFDWPEGGSDDPRKYVIANDQVLAAAGRMEIRPKDAKELGELLASQCYNKTGLTIGEAMRDQSDPIARFMGLMESGEKDLNRLIEAIRLIDDERVSDPLKKKWTRMIGQVSEIQKACRADPATFGIYVEQDQDEGSRGQYMHLKAFHLLMYEVWTDKTNLNSLIEAPVGHGKTTHLRILIAWEIGRDPELCCAYFTDEVKKAEKALLATKRLLKSERYRAIFPHIRVLSATDDVADSARRFTVYRRNTTRKDPTLEANSILSKVQGNRIDRIFLDDINPPDVSASRNIRQDINSRLVSVVESRIGDPHYSRIRAIATPWHSEDSSGIIERDVASGRLTGWRVEIDAFRINDDADGRAIPIWPEKNDAIFLQNKKVRDPRMYSLNYRLRAQDTNERIINRCFYYASQGDDLTPDDLLRLDLISQSERWLSIDPAGTTGQKSSDTGIVEIVITANGYVLVPNVWFVHETMDKVLEKVADIIGGSPPGTYTGMHWEAAGAVKVHETASMMLLRQFLTARGVDVSRIQIVTSGAAIGGHGQNRSKIVRLKECAGFIAHKMVRFAGRRVKQRQDKIIETVVTGGANAGVDKLCDQLRDFDGNHGTDAVDALTQWLLTNRDRIRDPYAPSAVRAPADVVHRSIFQQAMHDHYETLLNPEIDPDGDSDGPELAFYANRFGPMERIA